MGLQALRFDLVDPESMKHADYRRDDLAILIPVEVS